MRKLALYFLLSIAGTSVHLNANKTLKSAFTWICMAKLKVVRNGVISSNRLEIFLRRQKTEWNSPLSAGGISLVQSLSRV